MKPLVVSMQAFGPFARQQVIDFRELGDKSFFLIHGATGSGKTSILDGICFALFGDSSGGEREARQMRSHHADADTLTEVSFDFALGATRYRVRRVPEQMRPARRGGGETRQSASAELWRLEGAAGDETAVPLISGPAKVNAQVVDLLGFQSEQFRQVIMLPQGKFREFLMSGTQQREKILETLFGTEVYKRIEESLKLAAKKVADESQTVRTQRSTLLAQAQADSEDALDLRLAQQGTDLAAREHEALLAVGTAQAAEAALNAGRLVAARLAELDQSAAALHGLTAEAPAWAARGLQLAAARQAAAITPYEAALQALQQQLEAESARGRQFTAELAGATQTRDRTDAALTKEKARAPQFEQAIAQLAGLDALVARVAALSAMRAEHALASAASLRADAAAQLAQQALQAAAQLQQSLSLKLQQQRLQAAGQDGWRQTHSRLQGELQGLQTLGARQQELAAVALRIGARQAAVVQAQAQLGQAKTQHLATQQAWIAGQAARLALSLVPGQACAVCGARDHPAPAHLQGALVADATLQAAEAALAKSELGLRAAEQALSQEQGAHSVLEARMLEISSTLGAAAHAPMAQLSADLLAARTALTLSEEAANSLSLLENRLPLAEAAVQQGEVTLAEAQAAAQAAQGELQLLVGQLGEREAGVPAELADPAALQASRAQVQGQILALKRALDGATEAAAQAAQALIQTAMRLEASGQARARLALEQLDKARDLEMRLAAAGFRDVQAWLAARLDDAAVAALDVRLRAFEASLAGAGERHRRAVADTEALARPDLAASLAGHEDAKAAQLRSSNAVRDALAVQAESARYVDTLKRLQASYQALEVRYGVLKKVSDVANGNNAQRMSLQRYVLATLLDEVVAATTLRLRVMSRGRYEMRRKVEAGDQRTAAGLDLEIFDHYTGSTRAVSTLSGGESFLAALALALGLSDIVQSYAGGIRLDAIFVDEGFGSLDPEALDHAIRALKDLQQSGRMVGIISHVAELKEWIDARLELSASPGGSQARFVL